MTDRPEPAAADSAVQAQYEEFPYPPRDPADEQIRLITGSPSHIDELNHYVFAGGRDFSAPFSALIAGGGTGDAAIMLAQQLADRQSPGRILYTDISEASRAIAEARANARGLTNIRFETRSLLDLGGRGWGPFDYIDCCGVLHHLADPAAGLHALADLLAPGGGIGAMVYGPLGRTGVYPVQAAIRLLAGDRPNRERPSIARAILDDLPRTNWLRKNPFVGDHNLGDDAALFDLLLHPRDRAFSVPEIADLAASAGLGISGFIEPALYDPASHLDNPELIDAAQDLSWIDQCALSENLSGAMKTHSFYLVEKARTGIAAARPDAPEMVPFLKDRDAEAFAAALRKSGQISVKFDARSFRRSISGAECDILALCDGARSLAAIGESLSIKVAAFDDAFQGLYRFLNGLNLMLLRTP